MDVDLLAHTHKEFERLLETVNFEALDLMKKCEEVVAQQLSDPKQRQYAQKLHDEMIYVKKTAYVLLGAVNRAHPRQPGEVRLIA